MKNLAHLNQSRQFTCAGVCFLLFCLWPPFSYIITLCYCSTLIRVVFAWKRSVPLFIHHLAEKVWLKEQAWRVVRPWGRTVMFLIPLRSEASSPYLKHWTTEHFLCELHLKISCLTFVEETHFIQQKKRKNPLSLTAVLPHIQGLFMFQLLHIKAIIFDRVIQYYEIPVEHFRNKQETGSKQITKTSFLVTIDITANMQSITEF